MWLLLQMPHPTSLGLLFSGIWFALSGFSSVSMCRAHIALQVLQAFAVMLCRMAFCLSGRVIALHLDNSTVKGYLCNQGGTVYPFLSRLTCQTLSVSNMHSITPFPAYIPTHLNVEANYLSWGQLFLERHLFPKMAQAAFHLLGYRKWNCWYPPLPLNASIISPWKLLPLGVECLQLSLDVSGKLYVSSFCISSSNSFQVFGKTC